MTGPESAVAAADEKRSSADDMPRSTSPCAISTVPASTQTPYRSAPSSCRISGTDTSVAIRVATSEAADHPEPIRRWRLDGIAASTAGSLAQGRLALMAVARIGHWIGG